MKKVSNFLSKLMTIVLLLQGCAITKNLNEGEIVLKKQSNVGAGGVNRKIPRTCYVTKKNSTFLGMPIKMWAYQIGQRHFSKVAINDKINAIEDRFNKKIAQLSNNPKKKIALEKKKKQILARKYQALKKGNRLMQWGEAPLLYNVSSIEETMRNIRSYLHTRGYFDALVTNSTRFYHGAAYVTYHIKKNKPYQIIDHQVDIPDPKIKELVMNYQKDSFIKKGAFYRQEDLQYERSRIYNLLCNNGYYACDEQYIRFVADTNSKDYTVAIVTTIALPQDKKAHTVFDVEKVMFLTDDADKEPTIPMKTTTHYGITFYAKDKPYNLKKLGRKIPLQPNTTYNKQKILDTYNSLYRTKMFEYVRIVPEINPHKNTLSTYIHVKPYHKYTFDTEIALEAVNNLPRPVLKPSLTIRRFLGLLDTLKIATNVTWGEGVMRTSNRPKYFYQTIAYEINCNLELPQFALPLSNKKHRLLEPFMPLTKFEVAYNDMREHGYQQKKIKSHLSYHWQSKQGDILYEFIPYSLSINHPEIEDSQAGKAFKEKSKNTAEVERPSFLNSMSIKTVLKNKSKNEQYTLLNNHYKWDLVTEIEIGGLFDNVFNLKKMFPQKFLYYPYFKWDINYGQHIPLTKGTLFAYQTKLGVIIPYGNATKIPPEKGYYLGGSKSMRGWRINHVGPGTYSGTEKGKQIQQGNFLLQGNIELRQSLIGVLEGALFLDVGNIWMLHDTAQKKKLSSSFYKEFAIGTGIGLRLNFQKIFILCFDLGIKLYDPSKAIINNRTEFNFGIGYPF